MSIWNQSASFYLKPTSKCRSGPSDIVESYPRGLCWQMHASPHGLRCMGGMVGSGGNWGMESWSTLERVPEMVKVYRKRIGQIITILCSWENHFHFDEKAMASSSLWQSLPGWVNLGYWHHIPRMKIPWSSHGIHPILVGNLQKTYQFAAMVCHGDLDLLIHCNYIDCLFFSNKWYYINPCIYIYIYIVQLCVYILYVHMNRHHMTNIYDIMIWSISWFSYVLGKFYDAGLVALFQLHRQGGLCLRQVWKIPMFAWRFIAELKKFQRNQGMR